MTIGICGSSASLTITSFRTDDVSRTPSRNCNLHDAVVQYSEDRAGVQVGYSGIKHFKIIAGAGVTDGTKLRLLPRHQSKKDDPAPYVRIAAEVKF